MAHLVTVFLRAQATEEGADLAWEGKARVLHTHTHMRNCLLWHFIVYSRCWILATGL